MYAVYSWHAFISSISSGLHSVLHLLWELMFLYFSCVDIEERQAGDIDTYHCPNCQKTHGPLKCKIIASYFYLVFLLFLLLDFSFSLNQ